MTREQTMRRRRPAAVPRELPGRQIFTKPEGQRAIANRTRKAQSIWRIRGNEDRMTWRADDLPARCLVFREHATERQHHDVEALTLNLAACIRCRPRLEQADLQRLVLERVVRWICTAGPAAL